ncbi:MAG TPA: methyl-accepting chemotaxis protein, partial [Ferrovibrio sp.]
AVKKVSDIVAEIAAASAEQARGLEEVNGAVGNMDEMTQRNGALVEQTNASAQAMADQARQLAELVGHFRIQAGDDGAAPDGAADAGADANTGANTAAGAAEPEQPAAGSADSLQDAAD